MTRPIERYAANWCTRKDAWALTGRSLKTIDRMRRAGVIRTWSHPVRGLLLFVPDLGVPPATPPTSNGQR